MEIDPVAYRRSGTNQLRHLLVPITISVRVFHAR